MRTAKTCVLPRSSLSTAAGSASPISNSPVELTLSGGGAELLGFGSALNKTNEGFLTSRHNSYRGRALAVFRAGHEAGRLTVTVTSAGVVSQTFHIDIR